MVAVDPRSISGVVAAFALASAAPLGRALRRWSHHRMRAAESFSAGASLAYVVIDLMVELTAVGGGHVHSTLRIGRDPEQSLFAVVLIGATWWYTVAAVASHMGRASARYRAYVLPQIVYGLFVGGAMGLEAEHGARELVLFALPVLLHLTVVESHMHHEFEREHGGVTRVVLAVAPGLGAAAWVLLGVPPAALFMALALVAGSTVVQIIQTELPSPDLVRLGPFFLGLCVYSALVVVRWVSH